MAHRLGVPYLTKMLQKTLRAHIRDCLPGLRNDIFLKLSNFQKEIKILESLIGDGPEAKRKFMGSEIQKFSDSILVDIMGYSPSVTSSTFSYGAQINFQLQTEVKDMISQVLLPDDEELTKLIRNVPGLRHSISVPTLAVEAACRQLVERFKVPMEEAVNCVKKSLKSAIENSAKMLKNFPCLRNELVYQISQWIEEEAAKTVDRLKAHIDAEMFFINIAHPDFDSTACDAIAPSAGPVKVCLDDKNDVKESNVEDIGSNDEGEESNDKEEESNVKVTKELYTDDYISKTLLKKCDLMQKQVQYAKAMVVKYLEIIQKQVLDITVKYIAYFLVLKVVDSIKNNLVLTVLDSSNTPSFMEDYDEVSRKKEDMLLICKTLQEALDVIKSF